MKICKIEDCNKKVWWKGYCSQHGQRLKFHGDPLYVTKELHGMRHTAEYRSWTHMRDRCSNKNDKRYDRYGARGIKVCKEWQSSFIQFYNDMGQKPGEDYQIDRVDNDGNYEPSNCRWATRIEQCNNRSNSKRYTHDGKTMTIPEWARYTGMNYAKLAQRVKRYKWPLEKALDSKLTRWNH